MDIFSLLRSLFANMGFLSTFDDRDDLWDD